jgi:hypothetical protein
MTGDNYGIQHSGTGDIVNSGVQAFGPHATASGAVPASSTDTVKEQLAELRKLLAAHETQLSVTERAEAAAQLAIVDTHLAAPTKQRDKKQIAAAVSRLTTAVGSVATLVTSATALGQVIEQLVH